MRNDGAAAGFSGFFVLRLLNVSNSAVIPLNRTAVSLGPGAGAAAWLCAAGAGSPWASSCASWADALAPLGASPAGAVLLTSLEDAAGATVYSSFELLSTPAAMAGAGALSRNVSVTASVGAPAPDGRSVPVTISVSQPAAALLVTLTTAAQGRFSENALVLPAGDRVVSFVAFGALDVATLAATLRVEHARSYV